MVTDFEKALATVPGGGVEFIVIGGMAGTLHGSAFAAFVTQDLDVVYPRQRENIRRLAAAFIRLVRIRREGTGSKKIAIAFEASSRQSPHGGSARHWARRSLPNQDLLNGWHVC